MKYFGVRNTAFKKSYRKKKKIFKGLLAKNKHIAPVLILILVAQLFGPAALVKAVNTGAHAGSDFADLPSVGTESWSNPSGAQSSNNTYATVVLAEGEISHYLKATGFNFDIPAGSTINGIQLQVERKASIKTTSGASSSRNFLTDYSVNLTQDGLNLVGDEKATSAVWETADTQTTYGGAADLWGTAWTASQINSSDFGIMLSVKRNGGASADNTASIDFVSLKIFYTEPPAPAPNPALSQACGIDIALVLDSSGSINPAELAQMSSAFGDFVDAFLPETPTQFSVTDFDTTAGVAQGFTSDEALVNAAINAPTSGGQTNWEAGLLKAKSTLPNRPNPDLVVFASDGNPNHKGDPAESLSEAEAVSAAITVANDLKNAGVRIITFGIGSDLDIANLEAISSADAVYTSDFSSLAADLAELVVELCGGTITVTKIVDQDGNLQTPADQTPGENWQFNVAGENKTTDTNGQTVPKEVDQGAYSVSETGQNTYSLVSAACEGATNNGSLSGNTISGITVGNQDIVSCTFYNSPNPGKLTVIKRIVNDDNGQITDSSSFTLKASGGSPASFPGSETGTEVTIPAGVNYSVTEPDSLGYGVTLQGDCQGTMPAGGDLTCTVINDDPALTTGSLTVVKEVINDNGGTAELGAFTLTLTDGQQNLTHLTSGQPVELAPGTYTVGETGGPSGYTGTIGAGDGDDCDSQGAVTIVAGEVYSCTLVNNDQPGTLVVKKTLVNDNGGTASADDFSFVVNEGDAVSFEQDGQNDITVDAETYTVMENAFAGYTTTYDNCDDVEVANGETETCTITNNDLGPTLTVYKIVVNDNQGASITTDFTLKVGQTQVTSGARNTFNVGNYTISESGPEGYTANFTGDCNSAGEIILGLGDDKVCTITNTDNSPNMFTLTITKSGEGNGTVTDPNTEGESLFTYCSLSQCDPSKAGQQAFVQTYASGTAVTLSVAPAAGSNFNDTWTLAAGTCVGSTTPCAVTMNSNQSLTAHFALNTNQNGGGGGGGGVSVTNGGGGGGGGIINLGGISGTVYNDANSNGAKDGGEAALSGWTVYLDSDNDGVKDPGETASVSDANGAYSFGSLSAGNYNVREVLETGWSLISPAGGAHNVAVGGSTVTGKDFGNLQGAVLGVSTGPETPPPPQVAGVATELPRTGLPVELLYLLTGLAAIPFSRKK